MDTLISQFDVFYLWYFGKPTSPLYLGVLNWGNAMRPRLRQGGGIPMGGAKPKALTSIGGAQWVIKFLNNELIDAPLLEHAAMTLAQMAGI
jgi:hypothetical protein